jgi:hypothetical protein
VTGYKVPEVRPFPCRTEGCKTKVTNGNMAVCDVCFKRLYDRWSKILFQGQANLPG